MLQREVRKNSGREKSSLVPMYGIITIVWVIFVDATWEWEPFFDQVKMTFLNLLVKEAIIDGDGQG